MMIQQKLHPLRMCVVMLQKQEVRGRWCDVMARHITTTFVVMTEALDPADISGSEKY